MNRRAVVEMPALAIFTIIAGALIILLFVVLSQSQGERAQQNTQARSLQFIDTLIKSAATARETKNNITVIDDTLVYSCDVTGARFGYENNIELPLHGIVVFSPSTLEGGVLLATSRASEIPYHALNVLYLSSPEYVIQNNTVLPHYPFDAIDFDGSKRRKVIQYGSPVSAVSGDLVVESRGEFGNLRFITDNTGNFDTAVYPTNELLLGAALSRDAKTYNCVFDLWLKQVQFTATLQRDRANLLKETEDASCVYSPTPFNKIINLPSPINGEFEESHAEQLTSAINEIKFMNDNLLRGDSCATIY